MKAGMWFGFGVAITVVLVVVALLLGWVMASRGLAQTMVRGMHGYRVGPTPQTCSDGRVSQAGPASWGLTSGIDGGPCAPGSGSATRGGVEGPLSGEAVAAFVGYLSEAGLEALELGEVMEFHQNYYAVAVDPETGVAAMELILDKATGAVGPEVGPNMMWNAADGMHRGPERSGHRIAEAGSVNAVSEEMAIGLARAWLAANRSGEEPAQETEIFHGYYTIHTLDRDGRIVGMLSVHGDTGQVWYHNWHGDFVAMASPGGGTH